MERPPRAIAAMVLAITGLAWACGGSSPGAEPNPADHPEPRAENPPAARAAASSGGDSPEVRPPTVPTDRSVVATSDTPRPLLMVLGVAQDAGVPQAACDCPRCRAAAADPATRPRVASLALALTDGRVLLVDATPDLPWQLRDVAKLRGDAPGTRTRTPVAGVLLTHGHMGHYLGLAHLGFEAAHADRIPVYATESMQALLRGNEPWAHLVERAEIELRPLPPGQPLELGDVRVVPVAVPHRTELTDTVGFRFEGPHRTALYVPDCHPWSRWDPAQRQALLDGVDVALLDGTFYSGDELPGRDLTQIGHPLVVDTMAWVEGMDDPPQLRFIHLNHSNPALDPQSPQRAQIVRRGHAVAARGDVVAL